jgi:hypothetical protein
MKYGELEVGDLLKVQAANKRRDNAKKENKVVLFWVVASTFVSYVWLAMIPRDLLPS